MPTTSDDSIQVGGHRGARMIVSAKCQGRMYDRGAFG